MSSLMQNFKTKKKERPENNKKLQLMFLVTIASPAYLKKKDESIPCAALLQMRNIVAFECPSSMWKLLVPRTIKGAH